MSQPALPYIEATINFAADHDREPEIFAYRAPEGEPARTAPPTRHALRIHDARPLLSTLSLETEGVSLVPLEIEVDPYDPGAVRERYFPAVEACVAAATGAARVVAFDHNVRCAPRSKAGEAGIQGPVRFAHNDYTERSGPQRVRDLFPDEAEQLLSRRFAVINVWSPITHPVEDAPLAVCDARTIEPGHLRPTALKYAARTGEIYSLLHAADQRWLYFPQMRPGETMLLKCYDSESDGRARYTAHSAFMDPTAEEDAIQRESIEVRTLAFF
jgi:hypothetical protein